MEVLTLEKNKDIQTVRDMKHALHAANTALSNGDLVSYKKWMGKARARQNDLKKSVGIENFVTVPGTCKEIILMEE